MCHWQFRPFETVWIRSWSPIALPWIACNILQFYMDDMTHIDVFHCLPYIVEDFAGFFNVLLPLAIGFVSICVLVEVSEEMHDCYFVDLFVRPTNTAAINFYEGLGYVIYRILSQVVSKASRHLRCGHQVSCLTVWHSSLLETPLGNAPSRLIWDSLPSKALSLATTLVMRTPMICANHCDGILWLQGDTKFPANTVQRTLSYTLFNWFIHVHNLMVVEGRPFELPLGHPCVSCTKGWKQKIGDSSLWWAA